jgi:hypothetical protein
MAGQVPEDDYAAPAGYRPDREPWRDSGAPQVESPSIASEWPESPSSATEAEADSGWADDAPEDDETPRKSRFKSLGRPIRPFHLPWKWATGLPAISLNAACISMGAMVFGLILWRTEVVRLVPQTATFFKMAGMGVNLRGLAFEDVKITTETVNSKPVLLIEGAIVAIGRRSVEIPRLRFIVRDMQGSDIYAWNAVLEQAALNPGEKAWFKTRLAAPPAEGREIAVRFFQKMDIAAGGT